MYMTTKPTLGIINPNTKDFPASTLTISYGHWAIPNLVEHLKTTDQIVLFKALTHLSSALRTPEVVCEANRFGMLPEFTKLLDHHDARYRELVAKCFCSWTAFASGRESFVKTDLPIKAMIRHLRDGAHNVRYFMSIAFVQLTNSYAVIDKLFEYGLPEPLFDLVGCGVDIFELSPHLDEIIASRSSVHDSFEQSPPVVDAIPGIPLREEDETAADDDLLKKGHSLAEEASEENVVEGDIDALVTQNRAVIHAGFGARSSIIDEATGSLDFSAGEPVLETRTNLLLTLANMCKKSRSVLLSTLRQDELRLVYTTRCVVAVFERVRGQDTPDLLYSKLIEASLELMTVIGELSENKERMVQAGLVGFSISLLDKTRIIRLPWECRLKSWQLLACLLISKNAKHEVHAGFLPTLKRVFDEEDATLVLVAVLQVINAASERSETRQALQSLVENVRNLSANHSDEIVKRVATSTLAQLEWKP